NGGLPRFVKIGKGRIADEILAARSDPTVQAYESAEAELLITWARVRDHVAHGAESFLVACLAPAIRDDAQPKGAPLSVTIPEDLRPNPHSAPLLDPNAVSWHERDVALQDRGVRLTWLIDFVQSIYWNHNEPLQRLRRTRLRAYERAENQLRASLM